ALSFTSSMDPAASALLDFEPTSDVSASAASTSQSNSASSSGSNASMMLHSSDVGMHGAPSTLFLGAGICTDRNEGGALSLSSTMPVASSGTYSSVSTSCMPATTVASDMLATHPFHQGRVQLIGWLDHEVRNQLQAI